MASWGCLLTTGADYDHRQNSKIERHFRRLGDDACVGLGYAVAALVNYVGAARRAAWSCRGGSSKQSSSMALGGLLHVRLVCKTLSLYTRGPKPVLPRQAHSILR